MKAYAELGLANRFYVRITPGDYDLGGWAQVSGLDVSWDVAEYRAGDAGNHRWFFPGLTKYSMVKLTRAACADSLKVKEWLDKTSKQHQPGLVVVTLRDANQKDVMTWELKHAYPARWSVTGFEAGASKVAAETLDVVHVGFLDDESVA
ncbi:phage tail protein [Phytohabitans suffuscus]|uniref:Phage tail protein n=1 Tax=Phytohabitans suffuscus TaxID=624315 RepID=A0A6F8YRD3_9ACTN|nr:phage tail protein [Phytohabitans suffuscus]BCB88710.1 hypothetical protein Psuf_060230 [Phytohabitans suffuscus]